MSEERERDYVMRMWEEEGLRIAEDIERCNIKGYDSEGSDEDRLADRIDKHYYDDPAYDH